MFLIKETIRFPRINTAVTAIDIINALSICTVTAKAEHIPNTCIVTGLLKFNGSVISFLFCFENNASFFSDISFIINFYNLYSIDIYFSGGCKQIIPANFKQGFNKIDFIGYNSTLYMRVYVYSQNRLYDQTYPSFESTYLRTCKLPPDWYGDACSWNNTIDGNKGVKDIFKHMWGDSFNRIPIWDGNSRSPTGTYRGANSRNFNMPVILNTQLQNYSVGNQLVNPDTYYDLAEFDTTLLIKNQLIFTNIYYNVESMNATEKVVGNRTTAIGEEYFEKLRQALVEKQRDYEIYINTDNKTADSYDKQLQDYNGWAIELDLGMTDDYLTTKWADGYSDNQDSVPIKVNWIENNLNPPASSAGTYPSYVSLGYGLCPTQTSCWFGSGKIIPQATPPFANGDERFDWNRNQSVNRPVGRIWIQSKYDPNWLDTSNTGGEIAPYPNSNYPQLPQSAELNDTKCECYLLTRPAAERSPRGRAFLL